MRRARTDEAARPARIQAALGLAAALSLGGETFAQTPPATPTPTLSVDGLSGADNLAPFFQALQAVKTGERTRPVHILQIGDSHTAADLITGALRARLQAQFGEGGRGAHAARAAVRRLCARGRWTSTQSDGWRLEASFLPANRPRRNARPSPASLRRRVLGRTLACPAGAWSPTQAGRDAVAHRRSRGCVRSRHRLRPGRPGAGAILVTAGDTTSASTWMRRRAPRSAAIFVVRDAPVAARPDRRRRAGDVAVLRHLPRRRPGWRCRTSAWSARAWRLRRARRRRCCSGATAYQPDLIVLAFGTNDGFEKDHVDAALYEP